MVNIMPFWNGVTRLPDQHKIIVNGSWYFHQLHESMPKYSEDRNTIFNLALNTRETSKIVGVNAGTDLYKTILK